ncbi:MAG: hypothetical protein FWE02_01650 [Defluviitaleaceae bacterium]|nr:hypothetical protein [Defluviitaleaceae bacterium]
MHVHKTPPNLNRRQPNKGRIAKQTPRRPTSRGNNQNRRLSGTRTSDRRPIQKKQPNRKNQQQHSVSIKHSAHLKSQNHQRLKIKPNQKIKQPRIKYVQDAPRKRVSFTVYFLSFFGFFLGLLTLTAGANVTLQRVTNSNLESELTALLNLNSSLTLELSGDLDMLEIEYLARNLLNMSEPPPHQIRYIRLPVEVMPTVDFTVLPEYESNFFGGVTGFLSQFWNFITGDT